MIGTIGNPVVVPGELIFSIKNVALFKANPSGYISQYLCLWLDSPELIKWIKPREKGTTQKFTPLELLRSLPVPLPSLGEQEAIVEFISTTSISYVQQIASIESSLRQSAAQRQNILRAAFAGQLVPQDPNDEPASVLLERIRAERASHSDVKKSRQRKTKETSNA
jgi:type I restriction enzyme S subunit